MASTPPTSRCSANTWRASLPYQTTATAARSSHTQPIRRLSESGGAETVTTRCEGIDDWKIDGEFPAVAAQIPCSSRAGNLRQLPMLARLGRGNSGSDHRWLHPSHQRIGDPLPGDQLS